MHDETDPGYTLKVPFHMISFLSETKHIFLRSPNASLNLSKNHIQDASFLKSTIAYASGSI